MPITTVLLILSEKKREDSILRKLCVLSFIFLEKRSFISCAAAFVNVITKILEGLIPYCSIKELNDYSIEGIEQVIMTYIQDRGIKNGQGLWPVRTAVSGKQSTPGGASSSN